MSQFKAIKLSSLLKLFITWVFPLAIMLIYELVSKLYQATYSDLWFLFESDYKQFKDWYPSFHLILYPSIKILPTLLMILSLFFIWKKRHKIKLLVLSFKKPETIPFKVWQKFQIIAGLLFLAGCLSVYFSSKRDFDFQLNLARFFLITIFFQLCFQFLIHRTQYLRRFNIFLLKKDIPFTISILRILFFTALPIFYFAIYLSFIPQFPLPEKESLPFIGYLIDFTPINLEIYFSVLIAGIICCLFIVIGYKTRLFLIINAICCFYIIASPNFFGKLGHDQVLIWISWIFMFSRCYDVFSVDSYLNKTKLVKSANYTFPIRIIWINIGLIYLWSGFYKLWNAGFDWALSNSMINQMQLEWVEAYDRIPWIRVDEVPNLVYLGGFFVILFEMSYFFLLFYRVSRIIAVIGGLILHQMIYYFMYISFLNLQTTYFFFLNFNVFFKKKTRYIKSKESYSKYVFYFCMMIFSMNLIAGMFNINSYPFSVYPSYSEIIPEKIKFLKFNCGGKDLNIHNIGEKNDFKWEKYGRMERQLIYDFEQGEDVEVRVKNYWNIWMKNNPELEVCTDIEVFVQERPVAPEGKNNIQTIAYICTLPSNSSDY